MKMVGNFGMLSRLEAFLDMLEIVQPEADDLAGIAHRQRVFDAVERQARRGRRALGEIAERASDRHCSAAATCAEIGRGTFGIDRLQVDDLIALDDTQVPPVLRFETNDFHAVPTLWI